MSPGPVAEAGKAAHDFVGAMSAQPVMLGMVVVVLALIAMLWYSLHFAAAARKIEMEMIFAQQKEVQQMLAHCVVPSK
jgi:hypothetical protein